MQEANGKMRVAICKLQDAICKLQDARGFEEDIRNKTHGSIFTMHDTRFKEARFKL